MRRRWLRGLLIGWVMSYFFDQQQGKRRRAVARDWTLARFRRVGRLAQRRGRYMTSQASGAWQRQTRRQHEPAEQPDDATLAHKVESTIFRNPEVPKGQIVVNAEVSRLLGDGRVDGCEITVRGEQPRVVPADTIVAALGFTADLGPLAEWGLTLDRRHIVVDSTTATNLPRVFAAGDITDYPGKVRLIAVGFGEAATAVNNAAVAIDPSAHLFPGHSSDA